MFECDFVLETDLECVVPQILTYVVLPYAIADPKFFSSIFLEIILGLTPELNCEWLVHLPVSLQ